jgi:nickel transport protein
MRHYISVLIIAFVLLPQGYALAHKVNIFVYAEDEKVWVEGYFADGKKAKKSAVLVYDENGVVIQKGKTDNLGTFSFKPIMKTDLRVVLQTGTGHQAEYTLHASELTGLEKSDAPSATPALSPKKVTSERQSGVSGQQDNLAALDEEALKAAVRQAVAEASKPLARSLTEMQEKVALTEILGGIGYIFGILGIIFYLKSKKEGPSRP